MANNDVLVGFVVTVERIALSCQAESTSQRKEHHGMPYKCGIILYPMLLSHDGLDATLLVPFRVKLLLLHV